MKIQIVFEEMRASWSLMSALVENTKFALETLTTNRFRTFLSLLGIIIGVAAVIIIGGVATSGKSIIFKELETFGLKSLWVYRTYEDAVPGKTVKQGSGIDIEDIEAIARECVSIERISPMISKWGWWARHGNRFARIRLLAVGADFDIISNDKMEIGRFIMPDDVSLRKSVCILGSEVRDKLFGAESPEGKEIRIGNYKYTVVGVFMRKDRDFLASIGSAGGQNANARIIIPISVYQRQYNTREVKFIQAQAVDIGSAKKGAREIINVLSRRHKGNYKYKSDTMQQYIETTGNILRIVSWIGSVAAMISLVVGGIGIMNIMIASVVERTREIGIRKALGARRADILIQFLTESTLISLVGGSIGVATGIFCIYAIEILMKKPTGVDIEYLVAAMAVSFVVGVLSGIYPAMRAASMDPVEALKYE